jgi:hypothetical protein
MTLVLPEIFVTAQIAKLLGVPEWRIIKFAGGKEYGIKPALSEAAGSGTRRLYDLENVCEMALAWWLFQAGLRSDVVGWVLNQVREKQTLKKILDIDEKRSQSLYLAVTRTEGKGWHHVPRQEVAFLEDGNQVQNLVDANGIGSGFVLLPIGTKFMGLKNKLKKLSRG